MLGDRATMIYAQDDQSTLARLYGAALAVGQSVQDVKAWPGHIEAVTPEEVRLAAERWLKNEHSVTGWLTGPDGEAG